MLYLEHMKQGGNNGANGGFTIIEVLIVLAVSGLMFISAVTLVSGRQNKTEFMTAVNDAKQQIQQVINETASGYYPNDNTFECTSSPTGVLNFPIASASQGTNSDCVFLGKALQFASSGLPNSMVTYTIAGWSGATGSVTAAKPVLIARKTSPVANNWPSEYTTTNFANGLTPNAVYYTTAAAPDTKVSADGLAFISSLGEEVPGSSNLNSGTTQFSLMVLEKTGLTTTTAFADNFDNNFAHNFGIVPAQADICFASSTTNDSGLVSITAGSLAVDLQIFNGSTTCGA
jgi:prepilin-type N-terminal cleavage/methylation domain-containing protein